MDHKSGFSSEKHGIGGHSGGTSGLGVGKHRDYAKHPEDYRRLGLVAPMLNEDGEPIGSMHSTVTRATLYNAQENVRKYEEYASKAISAKIWKTYKSSALPQPPKGSNLVPNIDESHDSALLNNDWYQVFIKKQNQRIYDHSEGFGISFGFAMESCKIMSNK